MNRRALGEGILVHYFKVLSWGLIPVADSWKHRSWLLGRLRLRFGRRKNLVIIIKVWFSRRLAHSTTTGHHPRGALLKARGLFEGFLGKRFKVPRFRVLVRILSRVWRPLRILFLDTNLWGIWVGEGTPREVIRNTYLRRKPSSRITPGLTRSGTKAKCLRLRRRRLGPTQTQKLWGESSFPTTTPSEPRSCRALTQTLDPTISSGSCKALCFESHFFFKKAFADLLSRSKLV